MSSLSATLTLTSSHQFNNITLLSNVHFLPNGDAAHESCCAYTQKHGTCSPDDVEQKHDQCDRSFSSQSKLGLERFDKLLKEWRNWHCNCYAKWAEKIVDYVKCRIRREEFGPLSWSKWRKPCFHVEGVPTEGEWYCVTHIGNESIAEEARKSHFHEFCFQRFFIFVPVEADSWLYFGNDWALLRKSAYVRCSRLHAIVRCSRRLHAIVTINSWRLQCHRDPWQRSSGGECSGVKGLKSSKGERFDSNQGK